MNKNEELLSEVLMEMSAKALVTFMTNLALHETAREEQITRGNDFVYALYSNFILLRDILIETLEDIQMQSSDLELTLKELSQRLSILKSSIDHNNERLSRD